MPSDEEHGGVLSGLNAETRQRLPARAVTTTLLAVAKRESLAIIVDDLHWLDDSSARVLNLLMDSVGDAAIFLVAAYRPEFSPDWDALDHHSLVRLHALDDDDVRRLVETLLEWEDVPDELARIIVGQSRGNPYFVEEVLRTMAEDGVLEQRDGCWALTQAPTESKYRTRSTRSSWVASTIFRKRRGASCRPPASSDGRSSRSA